MMSITEYKSKEEAAYAMSVDICKFLKSILLNGEIPKMALSGGKSPIPFFQALSNEDLEWDKVHLYLVDERIVDTNSEYSNSKLIRTHLLQNNAKSAKFYPFFEELPEYLDSEVFLRDINNNFVQPNIVVLGMGLDGHTASIFPDSKEMFFQENIIFTKPQDEINVNLPRLSMSLNALLRSQFYFLLISGKEKKKVFDSACKKDSKLPISYILNKDLETNEGVTTYVYYSA